MTKIFMFFIYVSTIIAVLATLLACAAIFVKSSSRDKSSVMDLGLINSQIGLCKVAGVLFTVLEWFLFSCENRTVCLEGYAKLSSTCSRMGIIWLVFAFICILINMALIARKIDSKIIANVSKFRNSSFFMGAIYFLLSFILNV